MNRHGFTIDAAAIARGTWDMMPDEDRAPMVLGMIPLQWHDMVKRLVREKIAAEYVARFGVAPNDDSRFIGTGGELGETFADFVQAIVNQWASDLLGCAKRDGVLIV